MDRSNPDTQKSGEWIFLTAVGAILILSIVFMALIGTTDLNRGADLGSGPAGFAQIQSTAIPEASEMPSDSESAKFVDPASFPGIPAVHPSLEVPVAETGRVTDQDIMMYVATAFEDSQVRSIEYLDASDVEVRLDAIPGAFGGRLLVVVRLEGTFPVQVPPEVNPIVANSTTLVFDALTGNQLAQSFPP